MLQLIKLLTVINNKQLMLSQCHVYKFTDDGIQLEIEAIKPSVIPVNEYNLLSCDTPFTTIGAGINVALTGVELNFEQPYRAIITSENTYEDRIKELEDTVQELREQIEMLTRNGDHNET